MYVTEPYTVYPRKLKKGVVWYYQYRDEHGIRSSGRSTGCRNKTDALRVCRRMYNEGEFSRDGSILFRTFAQDFFSKDRPWYKWKIANLHRISENTLAVYVKMLNNQILPFFGEMRLCRISTDTIKEWIIWMSERWSPKTSNNAQSVLNIILKAALEKRYIKSVPSAGLSFRKLQKKRRILLTKEEVRQIYNSPLWSSSLDRTAFLLAAITGMRIGEVAGLQKSDVRDGFINVSHSYSSQYGLGPTKTRTSRYVPLPNGLSFCMEKEFLFERGGKPVPPHSLYLTFCRICDKMGLDRKDRGLTIHSLRNFFISYLQEENVPEPKIRAIAGHADTTMTYLYTYWRPDMFPEVYAAQQKLYDFIVS